MARTLGAKNKLPSRAWLMDQLVQRNFNALDEFVKLYKDAPIDIKARLLGMAWDFLWVKPRPENDAGEAETPGPVIMVSDEQLERLVASAKGK